MSWSYLFFEPTQLPLTPATLSEETAHAFTDPTAVQVALSAYLPQLTWIPGSGDALARSSLTEDGAVYEFTVMRFETPERKRAPSDAPELIVSVRTSGRIDSVPFIQRLCDALGWIAFDDRADLFQPQYSR